MGKRARSAMRLGKRLCMQLEVESKAVLLLMRSPKMPAVLFDDRAATLNAAIAQQWS
jgi:hypothetical protein